MQQMFVTLNYENIIKEVRKTQEETAKITYFQSSKFEINLRK